MENLKKTLTKFLTFFLAFTITIGVSSCSSDDDADDAAPVTAADAFLGSWKLAGAGSLAVGPSAGSSEWWSIPADAVTLRACAFDDTYTFAADGKYNLDLQAQTWLEPWQKVAEACGAPVAPHVSGTYGWSVSEDGKTLKITGQGAYIGLAKVNNAGELGTDQAPATIPSEIEFKVTSKTASAMTLQIEVGSGVHWTFKLAKQ
jgi:hypothetical protein